MKGYKKTALSVVLLATLLAILSAVLLLASCKDNDQGTDRITKHTESIGVYEGVWPVSGYQEVSSEIMDLSFEFPIDWYAESGTLRISNRVSEAYETASGGYLPRSNITIWVIVRDSAAEENTDIPVESNNLQLGTDTISGLQIDIATHSIDPATGEFRADITASDPYRSILILYTSESGRSVEEYTEVLNRLAESLAVDFEAIKDVPAVVW